MHKEPMVSRSIGSDDLLKQLSATSTFSPKNRFSFAWSRQQPNKLPLIASELVSTQVLSLQRRIISQLAQLLSLVQ